MHSDSSGRNPGARSMSRRRFVQGLAGGGAVAGLGLWPRQSWSLQSPGAGNVLAGTQFDLVIGQTPLNFTGRTRTGITVNDSVPAPLLRWREGTTVDVRVTTTGGTRATSASDQYTYFSAPTFTSLPPTSCPTGGGTTVVMTGTT